MCSEDGSLDRATRQFLAVRPQLFGIAYRVLGSATEAEDIVQETWVRWQKTDRTGIQRPTAFLATVTTRLAINVSQSARVRRESYVGPWPAEPVDTRADPQAGAERAEALDLAVLLLLERLKPLERAAYVLREAFDYPYRRIADILETSEANTRQLVTRARKHLTAQHRASVSSTAHRRLLEAFLAAARTGSLSELEDVLTKDAVEANGGPAVLVSAGGDAVALFRVDASPRGAKRVLWVMNPAEPAPYVTSLTA